MAHFGNHTSVSRGKDMANIRALRWRLSCAANYRLREMNHGRYASRCRPTSITFLLTELCNARCTHCDIWKNKGKEDAPTQEQWKQVLTDLRQWLGPAQVTMSGGEALLRRDTPEILRHGCELGLLMELLSHGYWPDEKRIEQVARARPWQVTLSVDGIGETHSVIRGKADFWEKTSASLETLLRLRREERLGYRIQLKTVLMKQNLDAAVDVARYAAEKGVLVFYQSIEQNYNTEEDPFWYKSSPNWPEDPDRAVRVVEALMELKEKGLPIQNSRAQLDAMRHYFKDPDGLRLAVQAHAAHETHSQCSGVTNLQIQANGNVGACFREPRFGNIKESGIREIWQQRPRYWETGCCQENTKTLGSSETVSIKGVGA